MSQVDTVQAELDLLPLNRRHWLVFGLCGAGLFFESLNLQIMSFVAPMVTAEWRVGPVLLGALISAAIAGMLLGTYLFGALADRFGRRPAFQATVAIFSVLTALSGATTSLWQLTLARFGAGVGIGGSIPVETAVLAEFTPARLRGRVMAIWAMALPVGAFVAPLCVAALPSGWGWRSLLVLGGAPALLVLIVRRAIPETPSFLASKGRVAEAERSLAWIARRRPRSLRVAESTSLIPSAAPEAALFTPALRRTTATAWLLNFGSFFAYYGFVLWMPALLSKYRGLTPKEVIRFMLVLAIAGLAGRVTTMALGDRLGRDRIIAGCGVLGAAALAIFAVQTTGFLLPLTACVAAFLLEGTFSAIIPYVAELYPPPVRATGIGWAGGMGRLGTTLAPICVGLLVQVRVELAIMPLAVAALLAAASVLFLKPRPRSSLARFRL